MHVQSVFKFEKQARKRDRKATCGIGFLEIEYFLYSISVKRNTPWTVYSDSMIYSCSSGVTDSILTVDDYSTKSVKGTKSC